MVTLGELLNEYRKERMAKSAKSYWDLLEGRRNSGPYGALCFILALLVIGPSVTACFLFPWIFGAAVSSNALILWMILFSTLIFLCSASEMAIAGTKIIDFDKAEQSRINRSTKPQNIIMKTFFAIRSDAIRFMLSEEKESNERKHDAWANSVIVIVNTITVVLFSVVTARYSGRAPAAFSVVGVTVITTLVGEVIPKQLAVKRSLKTLLLSWWFVWFLFFLRIPAMFAFGLVWPVEKSIDWMSSRAKSDPTES